jgi:hypothetical protein
MVLDKIILISFPLILLANFFLVKKWLIFVKDNSNRLASLKTGKIIDNESIKLSNFF